MWRLTLNLATSSLRMTFFLSVVTDFKFNNPKSSRDVLSLCKFSNLKYPHLMRQTLNRAIQTLPTILLYIFICCDSNCLKASSVLVSPPRTNSPYGLCGRKATLNYESSELRSCVKVEVAVLVSRPYGRKVTLNLNDSHFEVSNQSCVLVNCGDTQVSTQNIK